MDYGLLASLVASSHSALGSFQAGVGDVQIAGLDSFQAWRWIGVIVTVLLWSGGPPRPRS